MSDGSHAGVTETLFAGGGASSVLMAGVDWDATPLGAVSEWPQSLRSAVSICLSSPYPIAIYWGPDLVLLYNDAWSPILGAKHPRAMGKAGREVWPEIWHLIGPQFARTLSHGESTRQPDGLLPMQRHGYVEECYFDYSFSPIRSEGGHVGGVFNAVVETTYRVINARRSRLLRTITERALQAASDDQVCQSAIDALATDPHDVPFGLLYLHDDKADEYRLAASCGIMREFLDQLHSASPGADPWQISSDSTSHIRTVTIPEVLQKSTLGPWPESSQSAAIIPLTLTEHGRVGFLVAGISSRRMLDEDYQAFLEAIRDQIARALSNARALAEARRRADALVAIDRAKTAFFSNVSHEFRTPLTLMLGPIDDSLSDIGDPLPQRQRERLELVQRNGIRLLRLVNSLLDFSRIEAGRARASFVATDLSAFTIDLASSFRSAIESAGLALVIDCPNLHDQVHVDHEMWEKIVLNLLSNAFKHTFNGSITVRLRAIGDHAELRIEDTGVGIPSDHLPRLFERFYQVQGARSRSHEGSGIGLALVHDLARLHGGTVSIESAVDRGSVFTVTIPFGSAHLPKDQIATNVTRNPTPRLTGPYAGEAARWLPQAVNTTASDASHHRKASSAQPEDRILLVDDNTDMREYVQRLLSTRWQVDAVADGEEALAAARRQMPGIILSDVMMPRLDGFGLLRTLRGDPQLRDIPVILLSARAGEEASTEGREAGADDYLTKPFSANELIARVAAQLQLKRFREETRRELSVSAERLSLAQVAAGFVVWEYDPIGKRGILSPECAKFFGYPREMSPEDVFQESYRRIHTDDVPLVQQRLSQAIEDQDTVTWEYRYRHPVSGDRWLMSRARCVTKPPSAPRIIGVTVDMTEQKSAEIALTVEKDRWRQLAEAMPHLVWTCTPNGACDYLSRQWIDYTGKPAAEQLGNRWLEHVYPDDRPALSEAWDRAVHHQAIFDVEFRIRRHDGIYRWFKTRAVPVRGTDNQVEKWYGTNTDIHDLKNAQDALHEAEGRLAIAIEGSGLGTFDWHLTSNNVFWSKSLYTLLGHDPSIATACYDLWRKSVHPDDIDRVAKASALARDNDSTFICEYRIIRADDGTARWVSAFGRFLKENGIPTRMVGIIFDISPRKTAEFGLARKVEELSRANAELENFASIASHDLQEPLRMISNYAGILERTHGSLFDTKAREYFTRIVNGVQRMRSLIHAILAYSQVDKEPPRLEDLSAIDAINDALEHLHDRVTRKEAVISIADLPVLNADRSRLTQLFQNLISNALKFSASDRTPVIHINASDGGHEWIVSVSDNGIGIPLASQERIFHIFQRLHTFDSFPGNGIGLASCKKIVEQHGGRIWVESTPEVGSTFFIALPKLGKRP